MVIDFGKALSKTWLLLLFIIVQEKGKKVVCMKSEMQILHVGFYLVGQYCKLPIDRSIVFCKNTKFAKVP